MVSIKYRTTLYIYLISVCKVSTYFPLRVLIEVYVATEKGT